MAVAPAELLDFDNKMTEAELRQWVEANPGRVNDRDRIGFTPLLTAASRKDGLSMVMWLPDEKGVGVNATMANGGSALHVAIPLDQMVAVGPLSCGTLTWAIWQSVI